MKNNLVNNSGTRGEIGDVQNSQRGSPIRERDVEGNAQRNNHNAIILSYGKG